MGSQLQFRLHTSLKYINFKLDLEDFGSNDAQIG